MTSPTLPENRRLSGDSKDLPVPTTYRYSDGGDEERKQQDDYTMSPPVLSQGD